MLTNVLVNVFVPDGIPAEYKLEPLVLGPCTRQPLFCVKADAFWVDHCTIKQAPKEEQLPKIPDEILATGRAVLIDGK